MVNFFLIKLCFVLYSMSKVKAPSLKLEREKGEKQIVSSFLTLQVGEKRVSFGSNFCCLGFEVKRESYLMLKCGFVKANVALNDEVYSLTQGFLVWKA